MANPDSVSQYYLDSFGNGRIGSIQATQFNTAGNAVITIPLLSGGMTKGAAVSSSGAVIIVSITTSNAGNASNAVVANVVLGNLTATGLYQDLTVASPYSTTTAVSGYNTNALYVNINTASGNANTASIQVYGDVVSF